MVSRGRAGTPGAGQNHYTLGSLQTSTKILTGSDRRRTTAVDQNQRFTRFRAKTVGSIYSHARHVHKRTDDLEIPAGH